MTNQLILRYLGEIKSGIALPPDGYPDSIAPYLNALYAGQLAGNAEIEWRRVGQALILAVPDLGVQSWDDIPLVRKLAYRRSEMLALSPPGNVMTNMRGEVVYPDEGLVLLVGKSGSLKSFVTLYHAYAMAREGKRVAMILMEGFRGYRQRIIAHEHHQSIGGAEEWLNNIIYYDGRAVRELPLDLGKEILPDSLRRIFEPFNPETIDVAFVDTFRSAASIESENNNAEVGAILQRAQRLAATVVLVHHTRKNDKDTYAGASAMETNTHTHIVITYDKVTKMVKMVCENTKDDAVFSDTYYKVAGVNGSVALTEMSESEVSGTKARAVAYKSSERKKAKDEKYLGVLKQLGKATWVELSESVGESESTVKRWLALALKIGMIKKAGKQGRMQEWEIDKGQVPF